MKTEIKAPARATDGGAHSRVIRARAIRDAAAAAGISGRKLCAQANVPVRAWRNSLSGGAGQWINREHIRRIESVIWMATEGGSARFSSKRFAREDGGDSAGVANSDSASDNPKDSGESQ